MPPKGNGEVASPAGTSGAAHAQSASRQLRFRAARTRTQTTNARISTLDRVLNGVAPLPLSSFPHAARARRTGAVRMFARLSMTVVLFSDISVIHSRILS